jgi:hypothetical protein
MSESDDDEPVVGLTGARFGGARRRKRRPAASVEPATGPLEIPVEPPLAGPVVGRTGARFGRAAQVAAEEVASDEAPPVRPAPAPPLRRVEPVLPADPFPHDEPAPEGDGIRVRPYVLTGGRTRASRELPVEALISTSVRPGRPPATVEQQQVVLLCAQPRSLAEIAALVHVPLGVARVLVGDLADAGSVSVHAAVPTDVDLMRRVLAGLRRL